MAMPYKGNRRSKMGNPHQIHFSDLMSIHVIHKGDFPDRFKLGLTTNGQHKDLHARDARYS